MGFHGWGISPTDGICQQCGKWAQERNYWHKGYWLCGKACQLLILKLLDGKEGDACRKALVERMAAVGRTEE
jgi:hypothetical protein